MREYVLRDPFPERPELSDPLAAPAPARKIHTVTEITGQVRAAIEEAFAYSLYVEGELSDPKAYPSGHLYFNLKDANTSLKAVMWRDSARRLKFTPEQGLQVICCGKITFYPPRGEVKLEVLSMEPKGMGSLQLAFEQLKEKLQKEGLFAEERKRPLPVFPGRVGIVTSPKGAAIDDMLKILRGRVQVVLRPSRVQGDGAAGAVARGIRDLNALDGIDLIIVGRGGGSLEDLWVFNEEPVARALFASRLPVISAVGHEKDVTLSDLAADLRAATPTQAAEMVIARRAQTLERLLEAIEEPAFSDPEEWLKELEEKLQEMEEAMAEGLRDPLLDGCRRLRLFQESLLAQSPQAHILHQGERLHRLREGLQTQVFHSVKQTAARLGGLMGRLNALSPLAVLERGYSITYDERGGVVRKSGAVRPGEKIKTQLHQGRIVSRVESVEEN